MTTMPEAEVFVTLGVDTHKHTHMAVALDQLGRRLGELEVPTTTSGFAQLYAWASEHGTIDTVGIEGTGAYGAGLCRWLRERGGPWSHRLGSRVTAAALARHRAGM
jgi:transposase